jgi:ABC-type Mn2+/Zn2+ transport system permease subunit
VIDLLWEPLHHPFMRAGLAAAVLAGMTCGLLGVYVVLRRVAYIGHAFTHSMLPGLVLAQRQGVSLFGGALLANMLTALGIGWLSRREDVHEDTAIGVLSTAMFAGGLVLMAQARSYRDLTGLLFGQILGVTPPDLIWMGVSAGIVAAALFLFHKEWMLATLDPGHARIIGVPVEGLRLGFLFLLVLGVGTAAQAVGAVMTGALLVAPAAAARLLTRRLPRMMAVSAGIAAGAGVGGLYVSYYFSVPSGAAIVLLCAAIFGVVRVWVSLREAWTVAAPFRRSLTAALALNTAVVLVEAVGGWQANSLTLLLDVAHNMTDEVGLFLLTLAYVRPGNPRAGLRRAATVFNAGGVGTVILLLIWAAWRRLGHPVEVHGGLTLFCGLLAAAGNAGVAWFLKDPAREDVHVRWAHLHNVGDAALSLVPVLAGFLVLFTGRSGADALLALLAALFVAAAAVKAWAFPSAGH